MLTSCTTRRSYPEIVQRFAARPSSMRTVEQAITWHTTELNKTGVDYKQIQSDTSRGNFQAWAHRYGLANALWEAEEEDSVREALSIGRKLLDIAPEEKHTTETGIKRFVLKLLLEVGQWDDAAALLARFNDEMNEAFLWSAVLICFKSRGPESKTTRKALERATQMNPHVFSLLVGERLLAEGELERCMTKATEYYIINGRVIGDSDNAVVYYHNYSKYFFQEPTLIEWMKVQKSALEPILGRAAPGQSLESMVAAAAVGHAGAKEKGVTSTLSKVSRIKVCCANCGNIGDLLKCTRCQEVSYCNRQCQLKHCKEHKAFCHKRDVRKGGDTESGSGPQENKHQGVEELDHPLWARLNEETRHNLFEFHEEGSWKP